MKLGKNRKHKEMEEENDQKEENGQVEQNELNEPNELEELKARCDAINDKYLRLVAEFDNYRKRSSRERLDLVKTAGEELIQGLLPVLDDFQLAMETTADVTDVQAVREGIDLIYRKLYKYLESRGLQSIEAKGLPLDTDFHEAIAQRPVEDQAFKGKIIDTIQQGYSLHGKVIRYAKVVVGV